MARKRYTDEFRASAVVMLQAAGYPNTDGALAHIAKSIAVPHNTLRNWFHGKHNPPPSDLRQEKKGEIVDLLRDEIYGILGEMPNKREFAKYQELATSLGIAIDKLQLLSGEPTDNTKTRIVIEYADLAPNAT